MDLHNLVTTECKRRGLELIHLPEKLVRRSTDVIVSCPCTGQRTMSIRNFIVTLRKVVKHFAVRGNQKSVKIILHLENQLGMLELLVYQRVMDFLDLRKNGQTEKITLLYRNNLWNL